MKTRSCYTSSESYHSVNWDVSTLRVHKKIDTFCVDDFCGHCNTTFEAMGCYYHFFQCQEALSSLTEEKVQRGIKNRELDELRKQYIQPKGYNVIEMYECEWRELFQTDIIIKQHLRESLPYKRPLREERVLKEKKTGDLFDYFQCDIEVTETLQETFAIFLPIFERNIVCRGDVGPLIKKIAEEEGFLTQSKRMLISSKFMENGTFFKPLLLFYADMGLVCKKTSLF